MGATGENLAQNLLKSKHYEILATNLVTPVGEIDILARDGSNIVIIEVKTKTSAEFGFASEMVTRKKQDKLSKLGLIIEQHFPNADIRFDVITVDYIKGKPRLEHIVNAFGV